MTTWWPRRFPTTKQQIKVLHEIKQPITGAEPFLAFGRPRMIVNLTGGLSGSHNFFEGYVDPFPRFENGDILAFQLVRVSLVPMTWWERVWAWVRRKK